MVSPVLLGANHFFWKTSLALDPTVIALGQPA